MYHHSGMYINLSAIVLSLLIPDFLDLFIAIFLQSNHFLLKKRFHESQKKLLIVPSNFFPTQNFLCKIDTFFSLRLEFGANLSLCKRDVCLLGKLWYGKGGKYNIMYQNCCFFIREKGNWIISRYFYLNGNVWWCVCYIPTFMFY